MRSWIITFWFSIAVYVVMAQPLPCDPMNPEMTPTCAEACIICDINGFTGRHDSDIIGEAPPLFQGDCTLQVHNMQWIAFIAGSTDLRISLAVSNCEQGLGLEFGLYEGLGCDNFERISNCFGGFDAIDPGTSGTIINNRPLVIGQYYYIVMDGARMDNCDWTFNVLEGITSIDELTGEAEISGDMRPCLDTPVSYSSSSIIGATLFEWVLDGVVVGDISEPSVELNFDRPGTYTLCLTPGNPCNEAPTVCETITVAATPETNITDSFCEEDCFEVAGQVLCDGGDFSFTLESSTGCDSIVNVSVTKLETPITDLDFVICDGDFIEIGESSFGIPGSFQEVVLDEGGCDSLINLLLDVIECNIVGEYTGENVLCFGEASGEIEFSVINGTAPFTYRWEQLGDNSSRDSGTISSGTDVETLSNLEAGTYLITIADGFGNFEILITELSEPDRLEMEINSVDRNGFDISCSDSADAMLISTVSGGTPPYSYRWSNNENTADVMDLSLGTYSLTVTDVQGCEVVDSYTTTSPAPLMMQVDFADPSCEGFESGSVSVSSVEGGVGSYEFSLDGNDFMLGRTFPNLEEGTYTLTLRDENGCTLTSTDIITAPEIPVVDLGDNMEVNLGDSIFLAVQLNDITIGNIVWTSDDAVSCLICSETYLTPTFDQRVEVAITSVDECTTTDEIFITVNKNRNFYVPTVFSLSESGDDRFFTIFRSQEVDSYNLLIYDRWGNLVYEGLDMQGVDGAEGWNGRINNVPVDPGVFVWSAEITFIDGVIETFAGTVTILN